MRRSVIKLKQPKKALSFAGGSHDDLREFPPEARYQAGRELLRVQYGAMPLDFKPMPAVGKGAYELRVHVMGEWRVIYVAKVANTVHVLHAFQKKTQKTPKPDIELAAKRYKLIGG